MKKGLLVLTAAVMLVGLVACNGENNSGSASNLPSTHTSIPTSISTPNSTTPTSSSSFIGKNGAVSFDDIPTLLTKLFANEVAYANHGHIKTENQVNGVLTTVEEDVDVYKDGTSGATGTIKRVDANITTNDTYKRRNTIIKEKYEVDGSVYEYPMFVSVSDYEKGNMGNSYQDRATKLFIVSEEDATSGGLSSDTYITPTEAEQNLSPLVTWNYYYKLAGYLLNDPYATQTNVKEFSYSAMSNGNIVYNCIVGYQVEGDYNDVANYSQNYQFITDAKQTRFISGSISYFYADVNKDDIDDYYESQENYTVSLDYEATTDVPEDVLDVNEYFISDITDVEVFFKTGKEEVLDPNNIVLDYNNNYLFARAKTYTPAKALDLSVNNVSSSNEKVIALENNYFVIKGAGTTTLQFNYYGKGTDGAYRLKTIEKTITVVLPEPTGIKLVGSFSPVVINNMLMIDKTYTFNVIVLPYAATQKVKILSNSNPTALSASIVNNEEATDDEETESKNKSTQITLTANAEGKVTLILAVEGHENVTTSFEFTIVEKISDYKSLIVGKEYFANDNIRYGYTFTMSFNDDGTGSRTTTFVSDGSTKVDTFSYTIDLNGRITFDNWSSDVNKYHIFVYGDISLDGSYIRCSDEALMCDFDFNVVTK